LANERPALSGVTVAFRVAVVVHPKEKLSKCSAWPLRERSEFDFYRFPEERVPDLGNCVRLGLGDELLSPADAGRTLIVLDATWRYAERMEAEYASVPVRGLPPEWKTAYPRSSKLFDDPQGGLATVEALYVAYQLLGRDPAGLLEGYRWRERFLELNAGLTR
jgi:rRNA small subunit aminocarboxypropyltransferase